MRPVALLIAAPFLAMSALAVALAFPSPGEMIASFQPPVQSVAVVNAGGPNVQTIVSDFAQDLPKPAADKVVGNGECFQDLIRANKEKLDRCAPVVYQALIEVEKATKTGYVKDAIENPSRGRAVEQLRFAAVGVCRSQWATDGSTLAVRRSPACDAAEIKVASETE